MRDRPIKMPMIRSLPFLLLAGLACADGTVSENIRIESDVLGYALQYRVYLPETYEPESAYPVLYLTDGQNYLSRGHLPMVLDKMIASNEIEAVIAVFVDARDPDNLRSNRRNSQFLCNRKYLSFFSEELIPRIENDYAVNAHRDSRTIMGLSFGGLNAACFGLFGYDTFANLGMQSPANHPVPKLLDAYEEMPLLPLRMFLSTGKPDDNTQANRRFRTVLQDKGYDMEYIEVREGHNWDNWRPLLDDVLRFFYGHGD